MSGTVRRPVFARFVIVAALATAVVQPRVATQSAPATHPSLDTLFEPGGLFKDRNGDGVIDYVDVDLVQPESPTAGDLAAVADVAARLAFETSAMDLPLPRRADAAGTIVVGTARGGRVDPSFTVDRAALTPGHGAIVAAKAGGRVQLLVTGGDETGTMAAASVFGGRLPATSESDEATLGTVRRDVQGFLSSHGVAGAEVWVRAVYVASGAEQLERVIVGVSVNTDADVTRARTALGAVARRTRAGAAAAAPAAAPPLSYAGVRSLRVRLSGPDGKGVDVDVPGAGERRPRPMPRRAGIGNKDTLDLSAFYGIEGFFADTDNNLIPDRLDVMLSPGGDGADRIADLASRIGLESTGLAFPLARPAAALQAPADEPTLVLVGAGHPLVKQLVNEHKFMPPTQAGEGRIEIVKRAFGEKSAVVLTGGDGRGAARALRQVAERFPHVWERGKDRTTIDDIEEDVRRFLSGRSPAGQAATAIYKVDQLAAALAGMDLESASVTISVENAEPGLERVVRDRLEETLRADRLDVAVENRDVQKARTIFKDDLEIPSEVDDFWRLFRARVLPKVRKNQPVVVDARLNEPPDVRESIQRVARAELMKAGASESSRVTVLSAYKQGFSWLYDVVRPALAGKPVSGLTIKFAESAAPQGWSQQALYAPTRWLLEIFPVDELLARDLKIDLANIKFEQVPVGSPTYELIASAADGTEILRQTFEPKWVLRPYLDVFPNYEQVRITTGWIRAEAAGALAIDERIVTDTERFWDHYQANTLKSVYDHVMKVHQGKPRAEDAPFFGELTVEVSLSEPNYEVGVDKEQIMSLEGLHEDIYFTTLSFFDVLGRFTRNANLEYPGRIIPIMRPKADGKPGRATITFTAFDAPRPMVTIRYRVRGGREAQLQLDIPKVALARPSAFAAVVRDGQNGIDRLDLRVKVDSERDERSALVRRAAERQVDQRMMSAAQVSALVDNLSALRAAGAYREALAYHDLRELRITGAWTFDDTRFTTTALEANGRPAPFPDIATLRPAGYEQSGGPIVQWDTPIPPPEAYELLAKMSTFPEATVYKAGESYLGKDIWAMDLTTPVDATHWSQAKATTFKPTVVYTARQHANEVSSTSHVLKLAELLLTNPEFKKKLQKVNVVIHPVTNPDGAQLAYDLYKITPDYSLHAGYLGSLGADATSGQNDPDGIYPESRVRPKLWRTWLPDLFLNPHGYPHHMWVQPFSEFIGPVRNGRVTEERHWGIIRGWFMPGFGYLDDRRYPHHRDAAFQLRDRIFKYVGEATEMVAMNRRAYARYERYGTAFDNEAFKNEDFTHGMLIYTAIKGATAAGGEGAQAAGGAGAGGGDFMVRYPNVTLWTGTTEAPDETAYGPWLEMVATAGLQWDKAALDFLVDGRHVVERHREPFFGGVSISMNRPRPPRPPKTPPASTPQ